MLPARDTSFAEAQGAIAAALRRQRLTQILNETIAGLNRSSYIWFPSDLSNFMSTVPGLSRPAAEETEF